MAGLRPSGAIDNTFARIQTEARRTLSRAALPITLGALALALGILGVTGVVFAQPRATLTVTVADSVLSLEAVDSPPDQVLAKVGDALQVRIVIETVLAADLAKARITRSLRRSRDARVAAHARRRRCEHRGARGGEKRSREPGIARPPPPSTLKPPAARSPGANTE